MKQTISFVTIAVTDFKKELSFYSDVLHWKPFNVVADTIAFFNVGSFVFSLCAYEELTTDIGQDLVVAPYLGVTLALNLPNELSVDAVFTDLEIRNVKIIKKPVKAAWGGYSGYFADPEGHLWEVAHNPQFQYDDDGMMIVPE